MDPVQLCQEHAHPGRARWDLEPEHLLDREHEDKLVVLKGEVVDARGVGDRLPPALLLHVLLEPGVQITDHRSEAEHLLAVQIDDQP